MSVFSLDVRRARKGDCLLLHFGTAAKPGLAVIDGGPDNVYLPHLRPRLEEIRQARGIEDGKPLRVDLLMVSHADDDHIQGILDLTRELKEEAGPPLVRVLRLWHNSFDDIINNTPTELTGVTAQLGAASLDGSLPDDIELDTDEDDEVVRDNLKVLANVKQGHRLRGEASSLGFAPNAQFGGKLILARNQPVDFGDELNFTIAGPMHDEVVKLQKEHDAWLKTLDGKSPEQSLAAYVDKSVTNLSSIVVLAASNGKTMLLTGDARGDKILKGLELIGAIAPGGSLEVDILKIPHHGSAHNVEADFFTRILARHYVFSGNGEHGNPDRETIEMLLTARGRDPLDLHFTYPIDEIDKGREADWIIEQRKERKRKEKGGKKPVREDWSDEKHSLTAFFANHPLAPRQRIRIAEENKPHVIDLLDPLGF